MAKHKKFTAEQLAVLKRNVKGWWIWELVQELPASMIVKQRITGEIRVLDLR